MLKENIRVNGKDRPKKRALPTHHIKNKNSVKAPKGENPKSAILNKTFDYPETTTEASLETIST